MKRGINLNAGSTMVRYWIEISIAMSLLASSCKHASPLPGYKNSGYPDKIGKIMVDQCAVAGCHNNASYEAAAGLNLTTWQQLFRGANSGSVVIPFRPDFSSLCYFTNTDTSLGVALIPTMPIDRSPLPKAEYLQLVNWIAEGAPSATGEVMFTDRPDRNKFYVTNRMCDVVTVFDSELSLQTRYVDVGVKPEPEFPYCVKLAPDKKHWYVSFYAQSDVVQKFSSSTDQLVQNIHLGAGRWTSFAITADSRYGFFLDNSSNARIAYVDLEAGKLLAEYDFDGKFKYLSGAALNEGANTLYAGTEAGNFIYSIDISERLHPVISEVPIDGTNLVDHSSSLAPAELLVDQSGQYCFVNCMGSAEVRMMDMNSNKVVAAIALNTPPSFMAYSPSTKNLLVSCPEDEHTFPGNRGSVAVINTTTRTLVIRINSGYQPNGIAVDEKLNRVVVVNANISTGGPASHHASRCGEKNGNVSFIDLKTLKLIPGKKREVAVFPFSVAAM